MRSFWSEPFLWIHLAGLAALPLTLGVVALGLATGEPLLPIWLELLIVAVIGIAPVLWMQLTRPFDIFSLLVVALKPDRLTESQRRLLSLFDRKTNPLLTIMAAGFMVWVLWQIYSIAPLAAGVVPWTVQWHIAGLALAGVGFLASHLFLQVPLSVVQVIFTSETEWAATQPYPVEKIPENFTVPGFRVKQILPAIAPESSSAESSPEQVD